MKMTRGEIALWAVVLAVALTVQWPMLKGWFYRTVGSAAPDSAIQWRTDFDRALDEARQTGRPVLVDFAADWCPPCIVMKHDVWPDPEVAREIARGYVPLMVDVDRAEALSARYDVDAIPTLLILDGSGRVQRRAGYLPVSGMLRFLREPR